MHALVRDGIVGAVIDAPLPSLPRRCVQIEVAEGVEPPAPGDIYDPASGLFRAPGSAPAPTTEAEAVAALRAERTARLAACDWTQLPDAPLTADQVEAWRLYRQALRDLPEVTADPAAPVWPASPAGEPAE